MDEPGKVIVHNVAREVAGVPEDKGPHVLGLACWCRPVILVS